MAGVLGNSKEAREGRRPRGEACRMKWKGGQVGNRRAGGTQTSVIEGLGGFGARAGNLQPPPNFVQPVT